MLSEIKKNRGWWANKWGIQLGAKYIDAFGISNLDLQIEHNRVRPFTYSHRDSVANYTHYNQPLAHPLGANFREYIGIARYQPAPKWLTVAKLIYYQQGRDSSSRIYGSNILLPNSTPIPGWVIMVIHIGSGWKTNVFYASFLLSYEWRENLFLELNAVLRKQDTKTAPITSTNTSVISLGVRWNVLGENLIIKHATPGWLTGSFLSGSYIVPSKKPPVCLPVLLPCCGKTDFTSNS